MLLGFRFHYVSRHLRFGRPFPKTMMQMARNSWLPSSSQFSTTCGRQEAMQFFMTTSLPFIPSKFTSLKQFPSPWNRFWSLFASKQLNAFFSSMWISINSWARHLSLCSSNGSPLFFFPAFLLADPLSPPLLTFCFLPVLGVNYWTHVIFSFPFFFFNTITLTAKKM